jgi:dihydropteroate synthase
VDADRLADTQATAVAVAAISTWLGAPVIRTRHTRAVRRAIDMTASIAGTRVPARTIRGLA